MAAGLFKLRLLVMPGAPPVCPSRLALIPSFQLKFGAGEGIRTLDPNLGKVVLRYPGLPVALGDIGHIGTDPPAGVGDGFV
jgi:hypothetical protein